LTRGEATRGDRGELAGPLEKAKRYIRERKDKRTRRAPERNTLRGKLKNRAKKKNETIPRGERITGQLASAKREGNKRNLQRGTTGNRSSRAETFGVIMRESSLSKNARRKKRSQLLRSEEERQETVARADTVEKVKTSKTRSTKGGRNILKGHDKLLDSHKSRKGGGGWDNRSFFRSDFAHKTPGPGDSGS